MKNLKPNDVTLVVGGAGPVAYLVYAAAAMVGGAIGGAKYNKDKARKEATKDYKPSGSCHTSSRGVTYCTGGR